MQTIIFFIQTTCLFDPDNLSFRSRHRVFSIQTTCLFDPDNVSFPSRQRVFSIQTTCHFDPDNVSFRSRQGVFSIQTNLLFHPESNPTFPSRQPSLFYKTPLPFLYANTSSLKNIPS